MAKTTKKTGAAAELKRSTAALIHGGNAFGARHVKAGFGFTPDDDLKFALGWPHLIEIVEDHPDDANAEAEALDIRENGPFLQAAWPREIAARLARALCILTPFDNETKPGYPIPKEETKRALATPGPITADEAKRLIHEQFTAPFAALWLHRALLFFEAFVGPDVVADAVLEELSAMGAARALGHAPSLGEAVLELGFVLLRLPSAAAEQKRARWRELLDAWTSGGVQETPTWCPQILAASRRVLLGAEAFKMGRHLPYFVLDDPAFVEAQRKVDEGAPWGLVPDPRFVFLGGEGVYRIERRLWGKYTNRQNPPAAVHPLIVERFGAIQSPLTVDLMTDLAATSKARKQALSWFDAHAAFARPHLEQLASGGPSADAAKGILSKL
jgi:hypothetical protein